MANQPRLSLGQVTQTLEALADTQAEMQAGQARAGRLQKLLGDARGASERLHLYVEGKLGELYRELENNGNQLRSYALNFAEAPVNTAMAAVNKTYNLGVSGYEKLNMKMRSVPELLNAVVNQYLPSVTMVQQFVEPAAANVKGILQTLIQRSVPQRPARA